MPFSRGDIIVETQSFGDFEDKRATIMIIVGDPVPGNVPLIVILHVSRRHSSVRIGKRHRSSISR